MIFISTTDTDAIYGGDMPNFSLVTAGSFSKERFEPIVACNGQFSEVYGDNQTITFKVTTPPTA